MASPHHSSSTTTADAASNKVSLISPPAVVLPASYADAALLHVLATQPESVIPPGKTLRAALLRPQEDTRRSNADAGSDGNAPEELQSAIEKIVHRAFWDEARESLSDVDPSRQLARLRLLYKDLYTALEGLLPASHPSYVKLSDPLFPTPSPLSSARNYLLELTAALQERCAPARDTKLSSIRSLLESEGTSDLPERIVQAVKQLLEVADLMKEDLTSAVLGAVRDEELEKEVIRMARAEERTSVLQIYGAKGVRDRWRSWLAEGDTETVIASDVYGWIRRLIKVIGADMAISCPLPDSQESGSNAVTPQQDISSGQINAVPPVFALSSSDLFQLQNRIQALVITAVLRTLVPLQANPPNVYTSTFSAEMRDSKQHPLPDDDHQARTFADRILALLMIEADEASEDAGTTKLVNLADEVLREHRRLRSSHISQPVTNQSPLGGTMPSLPPLDDETIRSRVDMLLRPSNPVFILLRKRLLTTLTDSLVSALQLEDQGRERKTRSHLPETMHTGRDVQRGVKRPRFDLSPTSSSRLGSDLLERGYLRRLVQEMVRAGRVQAKGYEDPVLRYGIGYALGKLADVVEWVRDTWADRGLGLEGLDKDEGVVGMKEKAEVGGTSDHGGERGR